MCVCVCVWKRIWRWVVFHEYYPDKGSTKQNTYLLVIIFQVKLKITLQRKKKQKKMKEVDCEELFCLLWILISAEMTAELIRFDTLRCTFIIKVIVYSELSAKCFCWISAYSVKPSINPTNLSIPSPPPSPIVFFMCFDEKNIMSRSVYENLLKIYFLNAPFAP